MNKRILKEFLEAGHFEDFSFQDTSKYFPQGSPDELRNVASSKINSFLLEKGLKVDPDKTCVLSIEEGFDFLGFNFKEYPDIKRISGTKKMSFWLNHLQQK